MLVEVETVVSSMATTTAAATAAALSTRVTVMVIVAGHQMHLIVLQAAPRPRPWVRMILRIPRESTLYPTHRTQQEMTMYPDLVRITTDIKMTTITITQYAIRAILVLVCTMRDSQCRPGGVGEAPTHTYLHAHHRMLPSLPPRTPYRSTADTMSS